MRRIILDTNMLMAAAQFRVDILAEIDRICLFNYQLCIIDKTIDELNGIFEWKKGKSKAAAKLALTIIESRKIMKMAATSNDVDNSILDIAEKGRDIVATQDILLKRRLREKGISIITLRQKKYLILQE